MEVTINSSNLNAITGKIDEVKTAVGNIKVTVNASFSDAQGKFNQALNNAVDASLRIASTKFGGFWTHSVTKMQTDISTVEKKLEDQVTRVKTVTKNLETKSTSSAVHFEEQRLQVMRRQIELMDKQEQAFSNFKNALSQVAQHFMTVPRLLSDSAKASEKYQIVEMTRTQRQTYAVTHDLMSNVGVNEGVADGFYINTLAPLIKSKYENPEQFKNNKLVQLATGEGGDTSILKKTDENGKFFDEVEIEKRIFAGISSRLKYAEELQQSNNPEEQQKGNLLEKKIRDTVNQVVYNNPSLAAAITGSGSSEYLEKRKDDVLQFVNGENPGNVSGRKADNENQNFYNTINALDKANGVFNAYYDVMDGLLKQFPDLIAIAKDISAFGLAIASVVPVVHGLFGGFSTLFNILKGAGLINTIKNGAGQVIEYGKGAVGKGWKSGAGFVRGLLPEEGGAALRGLLSSELLATGGSFALRAANPVLLASLLKGDTVETPEQIERRIQYARKNAFKEMNNNKREVNEYEKKYDQQVKYYDDDRGFVIENKYGREVARLGQSLETVKHTIHELEANQSKINAVEKATGLKLTFSAESSHFVLLNKQGQIIYDIGKKLKASQQDIIKGALDAQKPSMLNPMNWWGGNDEKIPKGNKQNQNKLDPIHKMNAGVHVDDTPPNKIDQSRPVHSSVVEINQVTGQIANAIQIMKQSLTQDKAIHNNQRVTIQLYGQDLHNQPGLIQNLKNQMGQAIGMNSSPAASREQNQRNLHQK